jgi:hypothetical protein
VYAERETFGIETITGDLRRRTDWTEPPAEGDQQLTFGEAGDDD